MFSPFIFNPKNNRKVGNTSTSTTNMMYPRHQQRKAHNDSYNIKHRSAFLYNNIGFAIEARRISSILITLEKTDFPPKMKMVEQWLLFWRMCWPFSIFVNNSSRFCILGLGSFIAVNDSIPCDECGEGRIGGSWDAAWRGLWIPLRNTCAYMNRDLWCWSSVYLCLNEQRFMVLI